jgi:hypothetical protein
MPTFEAAKLERAWAGYYEMNVFDHNECLAIIRYRRSPESEPDKLGRRYTVAIPRKKERLDTA